MSIEFDTAVANQALDQVALEAWLEDERFDLLLADLEEQELDRFAGDPDDWPAPSPAEPGTI